jgi:fructose-bisphosphate aldolase class II
MKSLREVILEAAAKKIAVGHFNISDIAALKGIFGAAKSLGLPVIIGVSEGEREFIGTHAAAALVKSLREQYDYPIFINADHTYSFEKINEVVAAGFDMVIFDGAKLSVDENIRKTKEVVTYVKSVAPQMLVEAELGYIGQSSKLLKEIPEGAAITREQFTKPEEAVRFVKETGVDLFAPAVGSIHGMIGIGKDPDLDIELIEQIRAASGVPLVLHGGSGLRDEEFVKAAQAGMAVIHINTEIRLAWKQAMQKTLATDSDEVAPYKLLLPSEKAVEEVVRARLKLFSGMV